jgi:hypothetical protein
MARKSGWQDFADNFNSVYGTFKGLAQNWEAEKIMKDLPVEVKDDMGETVGYDYGGQRYDSPLSKDQLRGLQYERMGDMYSRWGDWKQGMDMQAKLADVEDKRMNNELMRQILPDLVQQKGALATASSRADLEGKGLTNKGRALDNRLNAATIQPRIDKAGAEASSALSQAAVDAGTVQGRIDKVGLANQGAALDNAGKGISNDVAGYQRDRARLENDHLMDFVAKSKDGAFGSDEEAMGYFLNGLNTYDPSAAMALKEKYNASELSNILHEGMKISTEIQTIMADPKRGLNGVVEWIDKNNGIAAGAMIIETPNGMQLVATNQETGDILEVIAEGADEASLRANIELRVQPGGSIRLAEQIASQRKLSSEAGLRDAQAEQARAEAAKANSEAVRGPRDYKDENYEKALGEFMTSPEYQMLRSRDPRAAEQALLSFKRQFGKVKPTYGGATVERVGAGGQSSEGLATGGRNARNKGTFQPYAPGEQPTTGLGNGTSVFRPYREDEIYGS